MFLVNLPKSLAEVRQCYSTDHLEIRAETGGDFDSNPGEPALSHVIFATDWRLSNYERIASVA